MERVLKELKKAQATFKQMKRDELEGEDEEPKEEMPSPRPEEQQSRKEAQPQQAPPGRGRDSFAFRGSFGNKQELSTISS
jgi:Sec-independent protein translocase protein TatA